MVKTVCVRFVTYATRRRPRNGWTIEDEEEEGSERGTEKKNIKKGSEKEADNDTRILMRNYIHITHKCKRVRAAVRPARLVGK